MASLILPCAGLSTRYTDLKPKFLIENPKMGNLSMVVSSVNGLPLNKFSKIYVVIRDEHEEKFNASKKILEDFLSIGFKNVEVTVIAESKSAADTVSQCININNIKFDIYIKDCDDYFEIDDIQPNEVCTISLHVGKYMQEINHMFL
jgi:2-C-methyl-D-erythritol 4-phosphate cytidylyltransferase